MAELQEVISKTGMIPSFMSSQNTFKSKCQKVLYRTNSNKQYRKKIYLFTSFFSQVREIVKSILNEVEN